MNRAQRRAKARAGGRLWPHAGRDELALIARRARNAEYAELARIARLERAKVQ